MQYTGAKPEKVDQYSTAFLDMQYTTGGGGGYANCEWACTRALFTNDWNSLTYACLTDPLWIRRRVFRKVCFTHKLLRIYSYIYECFMNEAQWSEHCFSELQRVVTLLTNFKAIKSILSIGVILRYWYWFYFSSKRSRATASPNIWSRYRFITDSLYTPNTEPFTHLCLFLSLTVHICLCVPDCKRLIVLCSLDLVCFFCQAGMRSAAPGFPTRLMITATYLLLCPRGSGPTLVRIVWIRVEISSASRSRLNKGSSTVSIQLLNRLSRCSRSTYAHVHPQLKSSRFPRVFLCGWERMTPSPREAGRGRTALRSAI